VEEKERGERSEAGPGAIDGPGAGSVRQRVAFLGAEGSQEEEKAAAEKALVDEPSRVVQDIEDEKIESWIRGIDTSPSRGKRLVGREPVSGRLVWQGPASGEFIVESDYWEESEYQFIGPVSGRLRRVIVKRTNDDSAIVTPTPEELEEFWTK